MNRIQIAVTGIVAMASATPALAATVSGNFQAQITIQNTCALTTAPTNLSFGTQGVLIANVDTTSTIKVTCTTGADYDIGLDAGANESSANDINTRRMTDGSSHYVGYNMYSNAGRTTVWGETVDTNTLGSTGTGAEQSFTVYGRVPAQTTPQAGSYADTVTVTVTY
ncbi:spore coat U domain-containing protein [Solimonas sp. K1W22B-7]|uniref:Csu type fimbrial protein n=1 Tax=Solimonas sp. K1W22B-7 TaxID=2303331 RepID=UPI000E330D3C|nr:spore coat U domain-containing protein [Solimonas sp. K1W22B-7]AXQ28432.1 spore coat U domain-containing protein [Solimonas sp. K1W22B-7]